MSFAAKLSKKSHLRLRHSLLPPDVPLVDDLAPQEPEVLLALFFIGLVVVVLTAAAGSHRDLESFQEGSHCRVPPEALTATANAFNGVASVYFC